MSKKFVKLIKKKSIDWGGYYIGAIWQGEREGLELHIAVGGIIGRLEGFAHLCPIALEFLGLGSGV